jgi:hypothetical protein
MGASACLLISLIVGSWRRPIADELNKSKRGIVDDLGTLKPTQPGAVGTPGAITPVEDVSAERIPGGYVVKDATGQAQSYQPKDIPARPAASPSLVPTPIPP